MRHETFHDTINLNKRKPNRLRGTPANKYSHLMTLTCVGGFALFCELLTRAEWFQPHLRRFAERTAPTEFQEEQKYMMTDWLSNSVIKNKRLREEGVVREDGTIYESANY